MSCESYDLRLTTLSPIHIGSGKSYNCCEFVPAKAKSKIEELYNLFQKQ